MAEKIIIDSIECYKYSVSNLKEPFDVILPVRYVKLSDFGQIMSELQSCVKTEDCEILDNVIKSKKMHRGKEFYSLSKIGPYTFADYIVAARDNSKFCASVIKKQKTPWKEEKQVICVKHTILVSQDKNKRFITEDEAHYICGILNSEIVQEYIQTTFKSNGFSLNKSNLYIPLYNSKNDKHKKISELAKLAQKESIKEIREIKKELTKLYLDICSEK